MTLALFGCLLTFGASCGAAPPDRADAERGVREAATRIRNSVASKDVDGIMEFVDPEGIACIDSVVPMAKVRRDLVDRESWLHAFLFDEQRFAAKHADLERPMSLSRFFAEARDITVNIRFDGTLAQPVLGRCCVTYRSSNLEFSPTLCLAKRGARWYFTHSPYPCG